MGGNRKRPDRNPSRVRKKPGPACCRAVDRSGTRTSEDSMGPVETLKNRKGLGQERSLVNSKANHYKQTNKKALRIWLFLKRYLESEFKMMFST